VGRTLLHVDRPALGVVGTACAGSRPAEGTRPAIRESAVLAELPALSLASSEPIDDIAAERSLEPWHPDPGLSIPLTWMAQRQ